MIRFAGYFLILLVGSFAVADASSCDDSTTVQSCYRRYGHQQSFHDVINLMISHPQLVPFYCEGDRLKKCMGSCGDKFRTSKFGHAYSMCVFRGDIVKYRRCWSPSFLQEAEYCYAHHFPASRLSSLYPIPIRLYSMSTIEEECFSDEQDQDCRYYKSLLLWNLMPTYYQTHLYPEEYRSRYM